MANTQYKLEKRSVNNKALFKKVHDFVHEGILTGQVLWNNDIHRQSFVDVVNDVLLEIADEDIIDQWNVVCDIRNNTITQMDKGIYVLEVAYRQKNCLNTTRLVYTITDSLVNSIKGLIDFELMP